MEATALPITLLTDEDAFESESAFLNDLLPSDLPLDQLDSLLSRLLSQLDLSTNDTATLVDRTIDDISRSVPRLTFDLQLMRENALLLRFTLDGITAKAKVGTASSGPGNGVGSASATTTASSTGTSTPNPTVVGFGEHPDVAQVMEKLRVLDLVKSRMEAARDVLREAESWSTLESEVTSLVTEQLFSKAAERLSEANRSLIVFQNTSEYEQRRSLMVSLQNQLEASLSTNLVKAIEGRDVKSCRTFYGIFGMMERESEFTGYYFGSRRKGLIESWSRAPLIDCIESGLNDLGGTTTGDPTSTSLTHSTSKSTSSSHPPPPPTTFTSYLTKFYSDLHLLLSEERTYVPFIFPSPLPTLSSFIITTLESLLPSLSNRLTSIQERYGPNFLLEVIKAYKDTEEFAVMVERIMAKVELGSSSGSISNPTNNANSNANTPATPSTPGPNSTSSPSTPSTIKPSRRLTKRVSMSKRHSSRSLSFTFALEFTRNGSGDDGGDGMESGEHVLAWETAIFEPFLDHQVMYKEYEKVYLESQVKSMEGGRDLLEYLYYSSGRAEENQSMRLGDKEFWELSLSVFGLMEDSIGRNLALTHGFGAAGLVGVLDEVFVAYLDRRKGELVRVREGANSSLGMRKLGSSQSGSGNAGGGAGLGIGGGGDGEGEEVAFEGLEYSTQDWTSFQNGLRLLSTCRSMTEKLGSFEGKLRARLVTLANTIKEMREDPRGYTIPGTTRGAVTLLRQSTLNSIELAQLLAPLEKTDPSSSSPPPTTIPLLPKSRHATVGFTRATQLFLHDTILSPLLRHLSEYASLPVWSTTADQKSLLSKGAFDLSIPTFSLSPTETISRVGEGLFNLPRLFEVYRDDDALSFSIETLPFIDEESLRRIRREEEEDGEGGLAQVGISVTMPPSTPKMGHRSSSSLLLDDHLPSGSSPSLNRSTTTGSTTAPPPPSTSTTKVKPPLSAETVIATWLSSLTLSILSHLTSDVLPSIPRLTKHGASQLFSDLSYISNVARALDVDSTEELDSWREATEGEGEGDKEREREREREGGKERELTGEQRKIWERVARIKGYGNAVVGGSGRR